MTESKLQTQSASSSLIKKMAARYGLDGNVFFGVLKTTMMKSLDGKEPRNEDVAAFMIVANKYDLDPFTGEIRAFPDKKGGIVPVVTVDGWTAIRERASKEKEFDGEEWKQSEETAEPGKANEFKPCPVWMEIHIWRKGSDRPIITREYFDEVYIPPRKRRDGNGTFSGPWQTHTKRMMRHKVQVQGYRRAFGITGIYDEDEYQRIIESTVEDPSGKPRISLPPSKEEQPPAIDEELEILTEESTKAEYEQAPETKRENLVTKDQIKRLFAIAHEQKITETQIREEVKNKFSLDHLSHMNRFEYNTIVGWVMKGDKK